MSAIYAARSDLFNAFPDLEGGCLLMSEAPAAFFWALCLVLAIGATTFGAWSRGGQGKELAARCEEEGDEVRLGSASGFLRLGRGNGYSSLEPWLIRHPTRPVVAPPPSRHGDRGGVPFGPFPPVGFKVGVGDPRGSQRSEDPWARASAVRGSDGWDKTLKT